MKHNQSQLSFNDIFLSK